MSQLHKTKCVVVKTVKYGESSLIISAYTELFGVQSYLINNVRVSGKKGSGKANLFQPGSILEMIVYHNELKNLQRIKECKWGYLYQHIFSDVIKNAVVLFMVEMIQKCVKQPEANPHLFSFIEESLIQADRSNEKIVANFPLYFAIHLATFFGFQLQDNFSTSKNIFDLKEGFFVSEKPEHPYFIDGKLSEVLSDLLKIMQPGELIQLSLNHEIRRALLNNLQIFYALHMQDFGQLKSLVVLQEVLN
ncbi:MAG TPA: DNA repair protein RecO [Chitinophagaceae bacterium]|nr:DNA repair protein RecO [Chitinophagaceae bacterium]